ncbi:interleukin-20-like [Spea bombifrons]|uniref:interleukin-20-like n=1 Tax=Spea bombifrons TaxID=233779 RepID=UPI00234A46AE|nr:interleukin-20-like [Spea bombifrons]
MSQYTKDKITDVRLLKASTLTSIHPSERCCFLLELGHFYVNNVFPKVEMTTSKTSRSLNHLANSILGLKIELKHCHSTMRCPCGEQSHRLMHVFKEEYFKLETEAAAIKAVGDLNILFPWLENNFLN